MADSAIRDVIRRAIEDCDFAMLLLVSPENQDELADRIVAALAEVRGGATPGPAPRELEAPAAGGPPEYGLADVGAHPGPAPLLSAAELQRMSHTAGLSSDGRALLAHAAALASELEALWAEVRRFFAAYEPETYPPWPPRFPLIAALLRKET